MKVQVIYVTRKFNLGNYQTVDYHVEASLDENENPIETLERLEKIINDYWAGRTEKLMQTARKEAE